MNHTSVLLAILLFTSIAATAQTADSCNTPALPSVSFKKGNVFLTAATKAPLNEAVKILKSNPTCKVHLRGYGNNSYQAQQLSWDRVRTVQLYLLKNGIDHTRIIFEHGAEGDPLMVDLTPANSSEEGPEIVPVPIPCLSFYFKGKRCVDKHGRFTH